MQHATTMSRFWELRGLIPAWTLPVLLLVGSGLPAPAGGTPAATGKEAAGLPFGPYALPIDAGQRVRSFSGGVIEAASAAEAIEALETARADHATVMILLRGSRWGEDDRFSAARWRETVERFSAADLESYVADGTLVGHIVMEEPHDPPAGREPLTHAELDEMAIIALEAWPSLPTGTRASNDWLVEGAPWAALDFGVAMYVKGREGNVLDFRSDSEDKMARAGLGLALAINVLLGGDERGPVSPGQMRRWGRRLARSDNACALLIWRYEEEFLSDVEMSQALEKVQRVADRQQPVGCRPS